MEATNEIQYTEAKKRVKQIKGFYTHLIVYVIVNIFIFVANVKDLPTGENLLQWKNLATPFFWGIGLLGHVANVFLPNFLLGKEWEQRKINELMEQEKKKYQ